MRLYQFVCMHSKTKAEINLINLMIDTVIKTINRKSLCFQEQMDFQVYNSCLLNFVYNSAFQKHKRVYDHAYFADQPSLLSKLQNQRNVAN